MTTIDPIRAAIRELEGLEADIEQAKKKRDDAATRLPRELGEEVLGVLQRSILFYVDEEEDGRGRLAHSLRRVWVGQTGRSNPPVTQRAVDLAVELGLLEPMAHYQATDLGVKLARAMKRAEEPEGAA